MDILVADASEVINARKKKPNQERGKQAQKGHVHAHSSSGGGENPPRQPCPACGKVDHRVWNCEKFHQMNMLSRLEVTEKAKLCEICLFNHGLPILSYFDAEPKVLIGLQNLELFAPLETRVGQPGDPVAVRSTLGWAVYGPSQSVLMESGFHGLHDCQRVIDDELNELMRQQYLLEETVVCTLPLPESTDDIRAREILEQTTRRIGNRFETGLIWKSDDFEFPDSWGMAVRRLKGLEVKLTKDPELRENVFQQIREYLTKGYAHKATERELDAANPKRVWYLPINVVTHPKKPEKKRLVWDAAARVEGVSLNSQLMKGPDLLRSLPSVICTFRERPIAFGGDIRKMFHQVQIIPEDKHSQRFLFRFDAQQDPDTYIMDVVTFGATCSPCSVQHVMHKNALESADEFPSAAAAIMGSTYMDDYFDSADSPEEVIGRAKEVRTIHARAGFEMRNWMSNSEQVLHALGECNEQKRLKIGLDKQNGWERVLGLVWNPYGDFFTFSTEFQGDLAEYVTGNGWPTKRITARCVMSLFDPMGLLAPYLIHGKMLIQDLWRCGIHWDQRIPEDEHKKWKKWLHVFTDASELGLGCAAYFRVVNDAGVYCTLVMAKSKVASIKYQSIPRRELQAATLGARLAVRVHDCHSLNICSTTFWTDSSTVLSWIRSDSRRYKQYVAHRVGEILTHSQLQDWRWLPSKENVADCLTKWGNDTEPDINSRWFHAPSLLWKSEENWPQQRKVAANTELELRPRYLLHHMQISETQQGVERVSKWNVLVRSIAFAYRFIRNCKLKANGQPIQTIKAVDHQLKCLLRQVPAIDFPLDRSEYEKAEQHLWRVAQSECFSDEVAILLKNRDISAELLVSIDKSTPTYNR
ncbi:uncharacterized protein LOC131687421 [Topomyia yanbarensis]|uniref:uncharacterized protein LOC131687421 n=1 Tax=Topomyia yanbarensis TaxID=2498891 RepID=UPI00273AEA32|nr:uncharacterized protein LOC131687421 [Topomyia yanbarensis]